MIDLVVLIGKKGSVFKKIIKLINDLPINIKYIITYNDLFRSYILSFAGILHKIKWNEDFFKKVEKMIGPPRNDLIIFSWFDKIIPAWFVKKGYRIYNQHPSLLPKFKGKNAWQQFLDSGEEKTGTTIHKVDEKIDHGKIIMQDVLEGKDRNKLHILQVKQAVRFFREISK